MAISLYHVILSILVAIGLQKVSFLLYRWIQTLLIARKFPRLPGTRLITGDLWFESYDEYMERTIEFIQRTRVRIHTLWVYFLYPVYSIAHPDPAKILLKSNAPKDVQTGNAYTMLRPWIGNGLLAHPGGKVWERNRHLLTPAFHFDILKDYVSVFNDVADDLLIQLSREGQNHSVEISKPVTIATLDSLLRCALSYHGNLQESGQDNPYVDAVQRLAVHFIDRIRNPLLYPDFIFYRTNAGRNFKELCDYVHDFADVIIKKRRKALADKKEEQTPRQKRRLDFLDILLTAKDSEGRGLTDLEVRSEVDTFMFAGHDTTSGAICWAIYALAKYEDAQAKVYEEVTRVLGDRPIEWDHLSSLTYLSLFIKEVMRMYSVVPVIGRLTDEPMTLDGVTIPANSVIELNIHAINHRPDVWPDYDVFRPERFDEPSGKDRDPFSFIPFSAGSRNCIGQNFAMNEQKVIISRLVQAFHIQLDKKHKVTQSLALVMRPKNGIKVFLHPR